MSDSCAFRRFLKTAALVLACTGLWGCAASENSPEFEVTTARYDDAFVAVRDVLRDYRFQVDRVDSAAGIITTKPRPSAGLATPWDEDQSSFDQELDDFANNQMRRVRVTFEPKTPGPPEPPATGLAGGTVDDIRDARGPLVGRVLVFVDRVQRPGWRLSPVAIGTSSITTDPALVARGMQPTYIVTITQDPLLAARLGEAIRERLATLEKAAAVSTGPDPSSSK